MSSFSSGSMMKAVVQRYVPQSLRQAHRIIIIRAGGHIRISRVQSASGWCHIALPSHQVDAMDCVDSSAWTLM